MPQGRSTNRRRRGRELALRVLFELEGNTRDMESALLYQAPEVGATGDVTSFARTLLGSYQDHASTCDDAIQGTTTHWVLSEAGKVERTALRLATAELLFLEDVPAPVTINEWVELTKQYVGEEGAHFVNGVLGEIERSHPGGSIDD
ncbi:MAG: transcription antitermination factor NusB [Candidatus Dormibacteria bacterium]